jgi:membrane protease YdiL (CAAX protease family)
MTPAPQSEDESSGERGRMADTTRNRPGAAVLRALRARNGFDLAPDAFPPWPSFGYAVASIGVVFATVIVFAVVTILPTILTHGPGAATAHQLEIGIYAQLIAYAVAIPFVLFAIARLARSPLRTLILARVSMRQIAVGALAGGAVLALLGDGLASLIQLVVGEHQQAALAMFAQAHDPVFRAIFTFLIVALGPLTEEIFFRGLIFNALYRHLPLGAAATISGFLFGLAHADLVLLVPLWLSGIALAFIYARYRNLGINVLAHCLLNAVGLAANAIFGS